MRVVLLLLLGAVGSQATVEPAVLCGRELAKTHSAYCFGLDPFPAEAVKSSILLPQEDTKFRSVPERFVYRSAAKLIEACCLKPCHISELLSHC